jgi:beta-galactosidase/beta-glucuronidase
MRFVPSLGILFILFTSGPARGDDWKPASTPLMTRWGKQVTPENAWREYPRPQLVRKDWLDLNGLWEYAVVQKGQPHAEWHGKILVPYPIESALSGVGKHIGKDQHLWYTRTFEIPAAWGSERVLLHFGGVDYEATVYVNGKEIGNHLGGFDPFSFDITDELKKGKNELKVRVWDPTDAGAQPRGKQSSKPGGIWYTPVTGLWQTVWLEPVPASSISGVNVVTADLPRTGRRATVNISVATRGNIKGQSISVLATRKGERVFATEFEAGRTGSATIENADLWTPDTPNLYDVRVELLENGKVRDSVESYFGVRQIQKELDEHGHMRLMLNHKPVFQIGPLDQGWWPDGLLTPPSDEAMKYDLEVLKKLGMNMLRKHIKVEPARYYYHCDRLGLLVWQDMPSVMAEGRKHFVQPDWKDDGEFTKEEKAQFRAELKAMIDHLRFFPSIVVWVPFNEGWGQHDTNDVLKWVKELDPSRLVNGPSGWTDRGFGDMKDMHNYPGPGMFPVLPDRVSVLGEFGGLGLPLQGHLWKSTNNWGYENYKTTDELRHAYRVLMHRLHPLVHKGLAAAVYTQTTDVEVEVNGLMTYDREVIKLDVEETAAWHRELFREARKYQVVLPTSEKQPQQWHYTLAQPRNGWEKTEYDISKWEKTNGGFGTAGTPGAIIGTKWDTSDIWLKRSFVLDELPKGELFLRLHHDEDVEVYINGVFAARLRGYLKDYEEVPITRESQRALKTGTNTIAVHCHQKTGGQYIDVGLVESVDAKK